MKDIDSLLECYSKEIEDYIKAVMPAESTQQKNVIKAMKYSIFAGGKRIRPSLVFAFCEACGEDHKKALPLAGAIEMIHTYSLIHDDLPCMDNDDFRRGKPSTHKVFGETIALLAGDGLLNLAFETALKNTTEIPNERLIKALLDLSCAAGVDGMIGGQVIDLESEDKTITTQTLDTIHSLKTAALIKSACKIGCIVAGADDKKVLAAQRYGENIGFVFQIIDDILDVISTKDVLGKPIGSDESSQKTTYATIHGVEKSFEIAKQTTEKAISLLSLFADSHDLEQIALMLLKRKK